MSAYHYILYDWDGCLVKTLDIWLDAYKLVCAKENLFPTDKEVVDKAFGIWRQGMKNLGCADPDQAVKDLVSIVRKNLLTSQLYPGAIEILQALKEQNKTIALLTSSNRALIDPALESKNLASYFDVTLANEDVSNRKPDPEIIHTALEKLGGDKDQAIIIGDSPHDIKAGHNAGITTVAFFPKHNHLFYTKEELEAEKPDYIISNHHDLIGIV